MKHTLQDLSDAKLHGRTMQEIARGAQELLSAKEVREALAAPAPLAFWRRKRGLTQKALSAAVGVSQSYVADLEAGRRKGDPALVKRLAKALKVRMEDLVADADA
jgi:predicted transcriptional regulator